MSLFYSIIPNLKVLLNVRTCQYPIMQKEIYKQIQIHTLPVWFYPQPSLYCSNRETGPTYTTCVGSSSGHLVKNNQEHTVYPDKAKIKHCI